MTRRESSPVISCSGEISRSVIVVGAGIVGCTVAYELAKAGARVQVIETRTPGQGATRASAGILAPHIEGHSSDLLRNLGKRSLDLYDDFMTRLRRDSGRDVFYQRNGTFELAFSDADVERLTSCRARSGRKASKRAGSRLTTSPISNRSRRRPRAARC